MFNQGKGDLHHCAVDGCDITIGGSMLMCAHHWFSVPMGLRVTINTMWRNNKALSEEYKKAVGQAIDAATEAETAEKERGSAKRR
jgi:hypothetical protein